MTETRIPYTTDWMDVIECPIPPDKRRRRPDKYDAGYYKWEHIEPHKTVNGQGIVGRLFGRKHGR